MKVVVDSTLHDKIGYPYIAYWIQDIDVRIEATPNFPLRKLYVFLKGHKEQTLQELAVSIITRSPVDHRARYGDLLVEVEVITEHCTVLVVYHRGQEARVTGGNSLKISDLVKALVKVGGE